LRCKCLMWWQVGFRLVCDNCSVQSYMLVGTGLTPSVQLVQLDTEEVLPPLADELYPKVPSSPVFHSDLSAV
jgi:hypothetical protein